MRSFLSSLAGESIAAATLEASVTPFPVTIYGGVVAFDEDHCIQVCNAVLEVLVPLICCLQGIFFEYDTTSKKARYDIPLRMYDNNTAVIHTAVCTKKEVRSFAALFMCCCFCSGVVVIDTGIRTQNTATAAYGLWVCSLRLGSTWFALEQE